jgi:hypothetical protein
VGTRVAVEVTPEPNVIYRWGGACEEQEGATCTFTMDRDRQVVVDFMEHRDAAGSGQKALLNPLTVSKSSTGAGVVTGSGIDCGADCTETFLWGWQVTLTATASSNSVFSGWSGACSGTGPCTVSMTQARNVRANFALQSLALSVNKAGTGSGTVTGTGINCGADCSQSFTSGTNVTLTAVPSASSIFVGWSGACTGTGTCTVAMTQPQLVTATFALRTYRVAVRVSGSGYGEQDVRVQAPGIDTTCYVNYPTVSRTCIYTFNHGTNVTLTARPYGSTQWDSWSGTKCVGQNRVCSFTVTSSQSETASFWDLI